MIIALFSITVLFRVGLLAVCMNPYNFLFESISLTSVSYSNLLTLGIFFFFVFIYFLSN